MAEYRLLSRHTENDTLNKETTMGKPQLVEDVKKPAAGFAEDRTRFQNPEDIAELREEMQSIELARLKTNKRATKVSLFMQDNFFRTDKTFPYLYWPSRAMQVSVRYFFPKKNLAIDQFRTRDKEIMAEVEFKKTAFKAAGVKYFPMFPENRLLDLADYI